MACRASNKNLVRKLQEIRENEAAKDYITEGTYTALCETHQCISAYLNDQCHMAPIKGPPNNRVRLPHDWNEWGAYPPNEDHGDDEDDLW